MREMRREGVRSSLFVREVMREGVGVGWLIICWWLFGKMCITPKGARISKFDLQASTADVAGVLVAVVDPDLLPSRPLQTDEPNVNPHQRIPPAC